MWEGLTKVDDVPSPNDQKKEVPGVFTPVEVLVKLEVNPVELEVKLAMHAVELPQ